MGTSASGYHTETNGSDKGNMIEQPRNGYFLHILVPLSALSINAAQPQSVN